MKIVHSPQFIIAVLLILAISPALAVDGPAYHGHPDDDPAPQAKTSSARASSSTPAPVSISAPAPVSKPVAASPASVSPSVTSTSKVDSVDQIKGIGDFKFGAKLADLPPGSLQAIDPKAKGTLLKVSPYGDNYLVTNLTDLTWGGIPVAGMIVTFHDGILLDLQVALKAKKSDFYIADRAFKDKYGPSQLKTAPVETWSGNRIQVTLILSGAGPLDANSLDAPAVGKLELFDQSQWTKIQAAQTAKVNELLQKRYQDDGKKAQSNL
jgi:hypothetical protein